MAAQTGYVVKSFSRCFLSLVSAFASMCIAVIGIAFVLRHEPKVPHAISLFLNLISFYANFNLPLSPVTWL